MRSVIIRMATIADAEQINEIYENYIKETAITFEYSSVPIEEFRERMRSVLHRLPYLVCEVDHRVVGYAYVAPFKARAAYGWDLEVTVYLHKEYQGRKIGRALYEALFEIAERLGYINLYALITEPNEKSRKLHEAMGFTKVGFYPETGYKFGRWWGVNVMWKQIGTTDKEPQETMSIHQLSEEMMQQIFMDACQMIHFK